MCSLGGDAAGMMGVTSFIGVVGGSRSKKLGLDGFLQLSHVLSAKEMSELVDIMREKELRVRTDIYEILLQDAGVDGDT